MSPEAKINQINFDLLFKNNPLPMWIYDLKTLAFLEVNDAAVKKYGYSRKKFLSMTLKDIRPKEDVERLLKDVSKKRPALQQSPNWRHKLKSGKVIDVEITSHTIKYNGRKAALVTARDITDQNLAEEKINKLNKVYSVLSDVNQTIVRTRNAKELFNSICRIAVDKGGFEMAWIGMLNNEDKKVKVIASAGVTNDYLKKINIDLNDKKRGGGPTGLAVKTGKPVISNNIEKDKRMLPWKKDAIRYGYRSSASFPIKVFGKVVGSFTLYSSQELFFNDEEINLLDEMVMDLSFTLEFIEEEKVKREAEQALRESEELLSITLSSIGDAVISTDDKGFIIKMNPTAEKLCGWKLNDARGKKLSEVFKIINAESRVRVESPFEKVIKTGKVIGLANHTILISRDGTERNIADSAAPIKDSKGNIKGVVLVFSDVTEAYKTRKELEESEQLLQESQKIARLGSYVWDLSKGSWSSSKILDEIFGIDKNYIRSLEGWAALVHPDWRETMNKYVMEEVIGKRKRFDKEYKIIRIKDGKERWVHGLGELELDKNKQPVRLKGTINDITERKLAEEERQSLSKSIEEEKNRLSALISNITDEIWFADTNKRFVIANPSALKTFGINTGQNIEVENLAKSLTILRSDGSPRPLEEAPPIRALKGEVVINQEEIVRIPLTGEFQYRQVNSAPVRDNNGNIIGAVSVVRDITEEKHLKEKLLKSERELQVILESTADGILAVDQNGKVIKTNKRFAELGRIPQTILDSSDDNDLLNFVLDQLIDPEQFLNKVRLLYNSKDVDYDTLLFKDGRTFERYSAPLLLEDKIIGRVWSFNDITDRKQAEEALQKSEERYRLISNLVSDYVFSSSLTEDGTIKLNWVAGAFENITGYTFEEYTARGGWLAALHPDDVEIDRLDMEILRKNKQVVTEVRTITKNGNTVWVRVYAHPVWDDQEKKVIGVYGAVQNITEQKLADEQLRISEITYRGIIDSVTETIYIQDEDGYFLEVNKAAEKMYGYPREFFIGKTPEILSAPNKNDLEFVKTAVQKAFEGKPQQFEFWGIKKDGTIFPKEVSVAPGIYFNQKVVIAVARDITERKRAEEELSNERTLLKNIIDSIPNPIYVKDLQGRRIVANQAAAISAGKKSVEEIIGKTNYELFSYDYAEKSRIEEDKIIKTGKPLENIERNFTSADGKEYWYIGNKVLLKDSKGNPFGILAVNLDITDRKLMEEKLLEKENQMRMIIEGTPQLFFYTQDETGKVTYISPSVKKITGHSVREWLNQSHWFVTDNKINEFARQETHAHLRGEFTEGPMLVEVEHADKHPILLEVYESPIIKNKKVVGLQGVAHDISERKRAEETLRESEERFRNLVENINEVFYITNAQGKIGYCSPNIETIIGYSLNEILGNSYLRLVASEDRRLVIDHYLNETAKAISDTTLIFRARSKDGKIIWVEQLTHIVYDTLGNVVEYRNVARDITERIKAQTTLQNERLLLRTLIDNIPDSIYSKDLNYRKTLSNLADLHFIGAESEAEVLGKSDFDIYPKEIAEKFFADDQTVIQTGIPLLNREEFIIDKKKGKRWLLSSKIPLRDKDNRIMGLVGIGRDITERKLAEEELRKSKEELQKFFEDDLSANYISTPEGKLLNCNKTFLNIFGFKSIEEALDFPIEKLYSDSIPRYVFIDLLKKNKKVESFEGEYVSLNGKLIYTIENAVAEYDSMGKFIQIRGYIVDITKRKKAEIELRKLSRAVEHSPASVMITNQDGDIEYVNEKFCEVTGYSKEEVLGKNPRILKSGYHDKVFYEEFWNHILSGKDWKGEMQNKKKNGELFWESVLISPLINKDGDITHFVAVKEDVTEKKGMIDELVRAMERAESANKLKDAFIANMSHEIRTPLNGILGLTSIIKDIYAEHIKTEDEELFAGIEHSSKRIIRTVDMILNYSRIQTGEFPVIPREIELSSICENLVKEFNTAAKGKALELSFKNKIDKKVMLFGDEYSITNSISNLIDNAIKYTNKGFVDIILYNGDEGEVLLDVKDSGIGISEGYIQHIFEPFWQEQMGYGRAYEGVGLGLPIVKKFLGLNNATISVVSKKGEGTTFTINFGRSIKSTIETLTEEKIIKNVLSHEREDKPTVLIVEDDVINQSTIKRFIDVNYNTVITDNSEGALQILKSKKIDLILMDISIKGDRNGLELTKELKSSKEFSNIPVIAITAHAFDTDRQNALKAGCEDYLSKPFSKKLLLETIGKFI